MAAPIVGRVQELLRPRRPAPIRAKADGTQAGAPGAPVRIRFDVLDEEVIERMAVCEIRSQQYIDDGGVTSGGVYDPRMGPLRHSDLCVTCGADMERCEGHPGLIRLACPVYHPIFLPLLVRVLRATCYRCAAALVDRQTSVHGETLAATALEHRLRVATKNPPSVCPVCEAPQTRVKVLKNGNYGLGERTSDGTFVSLRPDAVRDRLRSITAETRAWLGIGFEPLNLVMTRLLVPPSAVRVPVVEADGNIKGHDDLTTLLISVLRANAAVARNVDRPSHILNPLWADLQRTVCCYLNNSPSEKAGYRATRRNGSPMKGVSDRLVGKAGRMRGDLMGRRVDFSARTVITPDPNLDVDEVGVPASIARKVTVREAVTALNLRELQACVLVGPHAEHGTAGAALVERGGLVLDLQREHAAAALCLRVGDVVHRHLRDGDVVVMNRQPTLHAASMMAHRVRVLPYSTFRLNLSVTPPYNADFDGDEMNLHAPQSYAARAEIWELARVATMIVTPDRGHPCMAFVQDALLAAGVLTAGGVFIERPLFHDCLLALGDAWDGVVPRPAVARPRPLWTGSQLWSAAMRTFPVSIQRGTWRADTDLSARAGDLLVREGDLLVGRLTKGLLGQAPGSIVHEVWHRHGPDATCRFLSAAQRPLNLWLESRGFTVGIADCVTADPGAPARIQARLDEGVAEAGGLTELVRRGRLEPDVGRTTRETFEERMRAVLSRASADVCTLVRAGLSPRNNIDAIVTIGSKGSPLNLQQITGCLGQQILMQARMPAWFRGRTLPAFRRSDVGAAAGGFIHRSFIGGLDPVAFWFHAEASREGLIDTAIKTADSGYAQRKAIKTIEDDSVAANGLVVGRSVDTASGRRLPAVLQFTYGLDGFDGAARELQTVDALTLSPERIRDLHALPACLDPLLRDERLLERALSNPYGMAAYLRAVPLEASLLTDLLVDLATAAVATERWVGRILADRAAVLEDLRAAGTAPADAARRPMPFNLDRILAEAARIYGLRPTAAATLSPLAGNDMIDAWLAGLDVADPRMLGLWLRCRLGGWRGPCQHGLTREALAFVLETAGALLGRAAVEPGAPVGTLAGQSLGEPLTQMTLNSVAWDTEVFLLEGGLTRRVRIGEWIDGLMSARAPSRVDAADYLPLDGVRVPDVDEAGRVRWRPVEAVTRHPVVNADGSGTLIRVGTHCGRSVVATKGKSFLVRRDNRIVPTTGEDLRVGDFLPTVRQLPDPGGATAIDLLDHLPPDPRLFPVDNLFEALAWLRAAPDRASRWHEIQYLSPAHKSAQSFLNYMAHGQESLHAGHIRLWKGGSSIRRVWDLDEETGFVFGCFVGSGCTCKPGIVLFIAYGEDMATRIEDWLRSHRIAPKRPRHTNPAPGSFVVSANSGLLARAFDTFCRDEGRRCQFPPWATGAPAEFVRGLLIGYMACRTPNIEKDRGHFGASWGEPQRVSDVAAFLARLGIPSLLRRGRAQTDSGGGVVHESHFLRVPLHHVVGACTALLAGPCPERLASILRRYARELGEAPPDPKRDYVPGVTAASASLHNEVFRRDVLAEKLHLFSPEDRAACGAVLAADVTFSRVDSIEEVDPPAGHPLVYDLTVAETRNFALANGLCVRDTFHQAGVGKAPPAVRVRELLDQAGTKTPIMRVRFEPGTTRAEILACAHAITQMRLADVAAAASVAYTPADGLPDWLEDYVLTDDFDPAAFSPLHLEVRLSDASMMRHNTTAADVVALTRASLPGATVLDKLEAGDAVLRTFLPPDERSIRAAAAVLRALLDLTLSGVPGVKRAVVDAQYDGREPVVVTEGTNLRGLRTWALAHPAGAAVDLLRSDCNDPAAIAADLGVEAATACNAAELNAVYQEAETFVDPKHISVVADHIAWTGLLRGCTSNSIAHTPASVLACASFERTKLFFSNAAAAGRTEPIDDTASRIIFNLRIRAGTGGIHLRLDADALADVAEPAARLPGLPAPQAAPVAQHGDYIPADAPMSPPPTDFLHASPAWGASPLAATASPAWAPRSPVSPAWAPASPAWEPPTKRQRLAPYSPSSPTSALLGAPYSPSSPTAYSPASPTAYSPASPTAYSPSSPAAYSPASPSLMATGGDVPYSPTSPMHLGQVRRTVGRSHRAHGAASAHAYAGAAQAPFAQFDGASPASPVWIEALGGRGRQP